MSFLLDTNVLSEMARNEPDAGVAAWLRQVDEDEAFLSAITLAELRHGVERLSEGRRRRRLQQWLDEGLPDRFEGRIIGVDERVAREWGIIVAMRERAGQPLGAMDGFIAATARIDDLTVVTRNTTDFLGLGLTLLNPFEADAGAYLSGPRSQRR